MAAAKAPKVCRQGTMNLDKSAGSSGGAKFQNCAQRIEAATIMKETAMLSDQQQWDAEALFRKYDAEKTGLLSRGALTELLKAIGLERKVGKNFSAASRLAFDAHSADSHFLTLAESKQLYYYLSKCYPDLLPRGMSLKIVIQRARDVPPADANGKSDPFCTVMCCRPGPGGKLEPKAWSKSQTNVQPKTLTPIWNEEFSDKYGYDEGGLKCPAGHELVDFQAKVKYSCKVCNNAIEEGGHLFGCQDCSFDICSQCKEQGDRERPGDSLVFHIYDWDKGDDAELLAKGVLPCYEFHREGGFNAYLPMQVESKDAPKGCLPQVKVHVKVRGLPEVLPRLQVKIHGARGLPPVDLNGKSDPFCTFQIVGKPYSRSETRVINKTLDPVWGLDADGKCRYEDGDDLIFEIMDYDKAPSAKYDLLGRCIVPNKIFNVEGGFSGELPLTDVPRGSVATPDGKPYAPMLKITALLTDKVVILSLQVQGVDFGLFQDRPELRVEFEAAVKAALSCKKLKERYITLDYSAGDDIVNIQIMVPVMAYDAVLPRLQSPKLGETIAQLVEGKTGLTEAGAVSDICVQVVDAEFPQDEDEEPPQEGDAGGGAMATMATTVSMAA